MIENEQTARDVVREYVKGQLLGGNVPQPGSISLAAHRDVSKDTNDAWLPVHDQDTGFPILQNDAPEKVFATGIIHAPDEIGPKNQEAASAPEGANLPAEEADESQLDVTDWAPEVPQSSGYTISDDPLAEDLALEQTQLKRPTAMGLTSCVVNTSSSGAIVTVKGSTYIPFSQPSANGPGYTAYRRQSHEVSLNLQFEDLLKKSGKVSTYSLAGPLGEIIEARIRIRECVGVSGTGEIFDALTIVLAHKGKKNQDLFHVEMEIELQNLAVFCSPMRNIDGLTDDEEKELAFLYRHVEDWGIGHGVSVDWDDSDNKKIRTTYIPQHDQELLSTNIDGLSLSMKMLAEGAESEIKTALFGVLTAYKHWVANEQKSADIGDSFATTAALLRSKCDVIIERLQLGLDYLFAQDAPERLVAFRLMNQAMYLQQRNGRRSVRSWAESGPIKFEQVVEPEVGSFGAWYPFQIGFILLALPGLVDPEAQSREIVDLIYFPTGGGKTEAYLGLASLGMFHRRIKDPSHSGVDVLMRYTLRLLTVQQFERSAGLMAAMEHIRGTSAIDLGKEAFSIGVWLGGQTTPNTRAKALEQLQARPSSRRDAESTSFVLTRCPWCGAKFGYHATSRQYLGFTKGTAGKGQTLRFVCPDKGNGCPFSSAENPLPILITDEDIYECRPSFVLGTVDKFARITRVPESRAIFNLDAEGKLGDRLPPELIIQDELHLISGPLGSLVALYEAAIEALCSRPGANGAIKPKIVAATATTRNFENQAGALYARSRVKLFPQALNKANETFFSSVVRNSDGIAETANQYLGIFPGTLVSSQLATSQMAAVISQAPNAWNGEEKEIDYYSTALWFFNSLKELGQTLTLMQSTVVALQRSMNLNRQLPFGKKRYIEPLLELTGRISSSEVSKSLSRLAEPSNIKTSVHTCLASSIMEVGVDVPRLGLLTVLSQPKLTAQYIQVTGRVGRARKEGPGLIFTLYNTSRSRDRSIYERFRVFHQMLYANVEALSVTPFAHQTMDKGLIGATMALYRAWSPISAEPTSVDLSIWERAVDTMRERLITTSRIENLTAFEAILEDFKARWVAYAPTRWTYSVSQENGATDDATVALFRSSPSPLSHIFGDQSVLIPNSMRTVDGQTGVRTVANPYSQMKA